jgi:hypothetical protein
MLFTDRSLWTMVHGIGLGGAALMGLAAALFYLYATRTSNGTQTFAPHGPRALAALTVLTAVALWLSVLAGTSSSFLRTARRRLRASPISASFPAR